MKKHNRRLSPLLLPLLASAFLVSCVAPAYQGGGRVVYTSLPNTFVGSAYYHGGRYYSGGRYQSGRYVYQGRSYDNRYYHNGRYYYGGNYQQHAAKATARDQHQDNRKNTVSQKSSGRSDDQPGGGNAHHGRT